MLNDSISAYFAGAVDCDGWISIYRSKRTKGKRYIHKPIYYLARVGFTNTNPRIANMIKEMYGGSFYCYKREPNKDVYIWETSNKKAIPFLINILPFLQIKRRQAELALNLIRLCQSQKEEMKRTQKPPYRITEEMHQARKAIWQECTPLNNPRVRKVDIHE